MPHSLIVGTTESGKTALAKQIAAQYYERGINVIVLDPLNDPEWSATYQTTNEAKFLEAFWGNRKCAVFIDESGESIGRYNNSMNKCLTRGRHWGHNVHVITQRATLVSPTARNMCTQLFLFLSAKADCQILADDFVKPELLKGTTLPKLHYLWCSRFSPVKPGKIIFKEVKK